MTSSRNAELTNSRVSSSMSRARIRAERNPAARSAISAFGECLGPDLQGVAIPVGASLGKHGIEQLAALTLVQFDARGNQPREVFAVVLDPVAILALDHIEADPVAGPVGENRAHRIACRYGVDLERRAERRAQRVLQLFRRDHSKGPLRSCTRKNLRAASQKPFSVQAKRRRCGIPEDGTRRRLSTLPGPISMPPRQQWAWACRPGWFP